MNCKKGDLAVIVRAIRTPEILGRVVTVLRAAEESEFVRTRPGFVWMIGVSGGKLPVAMVRRSDFQFTGEVREVAERAMFDDCLRPIRDGEGADETLTWAGKPKTDELHPKQQREFAR